MCLMSVEDIDIERLLGLVSGKKVTVQATKKTFWLQSGDCGRDFEEVEVEFVVD